MIDVKGGAKSLSRGIEGVQLGGGVPYAQFGVGGEGLSGLLTFSFCTHSAGKVGMPRVILTVSARVVGTL